MPRISTALALQRAGRFLLKSAHSSDVPPQERVRQELLPVPGQGGRKKAPCATCRGGAGGRAAMAELLAGDAVAVAV